MGNTMLSSKQRAQLRGMASTIDTIVIVGKGGITQQVIAQMNDALKARQVQCIGSKFVLYKRNDAEPKIELVRTKK